MPVKYIPYYPNTVEGQAILDNITRTQRVLRYRENDKVYDRIKRGMPYYELEPLENVDTPTSGTGESDVYSRQLFSVPVKFVWLLVLAGLMCKSREYLPLIHVMWQIFLLTNYK